MERTLRWYGAKFDTVPGYGLYDRALGAAYLNGLWEAIVKGAKES